MFCNHIEEIERLTAENERLRVPHHESCDILDLNAEGITKPCNCWGYALRENSSLHAELEKAQEDSERLAFYIDAFLGGDPSRSKPGRRRWRVHHSVTEFLVTLWAVVPDGKGYSKDVRHSEHSTFRKAIDVARAAEESEDG